MNSFDKLNQEMEKVEREQNKAIGFASSIFSFINNPQGLEKLIDMFEEENIIKAAPVVTLNYFNYPSPQNNGYCRTYLNREEFDNWIDYVDNRINDMVGFAVLIKTKTWEEINDPESDYYEDHSEDQKEKIERALVKLWKEFSMDLVVKHLEDNTKDLVAFVSEMPGVLDLFKAWKESKT